MNDYDMARENFVNMGEMMMRLIYQMNIGWQEFLGFYTGLNEVRKQYDEKFQEQRHIGEETDDPNNSDDDAEEEVKKEAQQYPRFSVAYRAMPAPNTNLFSEKKEEEGELATPLLKESGINLETDQSSLLAEDQEKN